MKNCVGWGSSAGHHKGIISPRSMSWMRILRLRERTETLRRTAETQGRDQRGRLERQQYEELSGARKIR